MSKKIKEMKNLKTIKLESIFDSLTFEEMSSVLSSLSGSLTRDLVSFELPSNAVSCNFPEEFGAFLSECPLTVLNLYNCGLGQEGLKRVSDYLDKLENKENLQLFNISKNRINKIDESFGQTLNKFQSLVEFRISNNTIEEESMAVFLRSINNKKIEILDLSDNFICGECPEDLGDLFVRSESLKCLYLQDSKMDKGDLNILLKICSSKQVQELPGGIVDSKPELTLDISCNDFEQDSVVYLEILAKKFSVKKLVVFENCYDDIEELKDIISKDGGVVVEEEDNEELFEIDDNIVEKLKNL